MIVVPPWCYHLRVAVPKRTKRISAYISRETEDELKEVARRERRTMSNLLRAWIEERVEQERKTKVKRR